jgi:ubiquinone biosynthesis protein
MLSRDLLQTAQRRALTVGTLVQLQLRNALLNPSKREQGAWLAERFQALGPTYVKAGQFVSSRQDVFGEEFSEPFGALRDRVRPIDRADVEAVLSRCIDASAFRSIDYDPIASASIGQVHAAVLSNGARVVIKIKRPGIDAVIKEDIEFLTAVIDVITRVNGASAENRAQAMGFLRELETHLVRESDFRLEAKNAERFRAMYADDPAVRIPATLPTLCNASVIVMEYVPCSGMDTFAPDGAALRRDMANRVMDTFVSQLVYKGLVHGDPHSGNLGFDDKGRLVLYDFGSVIDITTEERQRMKEMIYQLLVGNNRAVSDTLKKLGVRVLDEGAMEAYIDLYRDYMRTIDVSTIATGAAAAGAAQGPDTPVPVQLTDTFVRLIRVYGMLEGTCKRISADFNYFDLLDNYIDELFFDEEFISYKIAEDVRSLFAPARPPAPAPPPAPPPAPGRAAIGAKEVAILLLLAHALLPP